MCSARACDCGLMCVTNNRHRREHYHGFTILPKEGSQAGIRT